MVVKKNQNRTLLRHAVFVACAIALSACGGGGTGDVSLTKTGVALYTSVSGTVTLASGASTVATIGGGGGGAAKTAYSATTNSAGVATATVSGNQLTINGIAAGSAIITVNDNTGSGTAVNIPVTVTASTSQPTAALYTTVQSAVTLPVAVPTDYKIAGGTGPYSATSSDNSVAKVAITGNAITITGVAAGTATIAAFDATGSSVRTVVTVGSVTTPTALYSTAQSAVTIPVSAPANYIVAGGVGPYTATSSNTATASATVIGNTLTITGAAGGLANIAVFDSTGAKLQIAVTVNAGPTIALYTTAPSPLIVPVGATTTSYTIGGGKAPYTVSASNSGVATAVLNGSTLKITGITNGIGNIVVYDSLGAASTIGVTVGNGNNASTALYTTAHASVTLAAGSATPFTVAGGVAPYTTNSSDPAIATGSITANTITINANKPGSAVVSILDSAQTTINVLIVVGNSTSLFSTAPSAVSIRPGSAPVYAITGGVAPYVATSSATAIATASLTGGALTVTGVASGTANIVVSDAAQNTLTIAVTVP